MKRWPLAKQEAILTSRREDDLKPGRLKAMVKKEAHHKKLTKARLIQYYPNLRTQSEFGWLFSLLQKSVFAWANGFEFRGIRITFASGMSGDDLSEWMTRVHDRFGQPWFYERDGKNWDSSMQRFHHDLKMLLYAAVDPAFAAFVEAGFVSMGMVPFEDGVFKYRICGTVKSGHNDTTLGNSLINAMIALEALVAMGLEGEILVAGDDLLVATRVDPTGLDVVERSLGITPEWRVFRDYLDVSFISGVWLRGSDGFLFLPKLGRLFARLWWTVHPPPPRKMEAYRASVTRGLRTACAGVPLYDDFVRPCEGGEYQLGRDWARKLPSYGGSRASEATVEDLCRKYHLSRNELPELQSFLAALPQKPVGFGHPLVDRVLEVDLADIGVRPLAAACA